MGSLRQHSSRNRILALALAGLTGMICVNPRSHQNPSLGAISNAPASFPEPDQSTRARVSQVYAKLPLSFEANRGQADARVKFISRGSGYSLLLTSSEAVLSLSRPVAPSSYKETGTARMVKERVAKQRQAVLRMKLIGANPSPLVEGVDELPGKSNYFIGSDPNQWRTDVPNYAKVRYRDVYPGVDMIYYGNQRQLEYDLVVAPGADPTRIKLCFEGAQRIQEDTNGDLILRTADGEVRLSKPLVYQRSEGRKEEIKGRYVLRGKNTVGFELISYDPRRSVVIDPVLSYSTYLGGSNTETGYSIAVDAAGNAYVMGQVSSTDFPTTPNAFQRTLGGDTNVFVAKLNASGSALLYSSFLGGGNGGTNSNSLALDAAGNVYITGSTVGSFPATPGAFQTTRNGPVAAYVAKLNPSASGAASLVYATYLGSSSTGNGTLGYGIAVDTAGNAYVTGITGATNFPNRSNAFQQAYGGGSLDAFLAKLDPTGSNLTYFTYIGGSSYEFGRGVAVDSAGNAYVTGDTTSADFPTTTGSVQRIFGGGTCNSSPCQDVFITKINTTAAGAASLIYSTFLGGNKDEFGNSIAIDSSGNAYVAGATASTDFPVTPGSAQASYGGNTCPILPFGCPDAFVSKLNATGTALLYSTYLGGNNRDEARSITVDAAGRAYITGLTGSADFPTTVNATQPIKKGALPGETCSGCEDAFVSVLTPTGDALFYSTFLGGANSDIGNGIALDPANNIYITGSTSSSGWPVTPGAFQQSLAGKDFFSDAFVTKMTSVGSGDCTSTISPNTQTFGNGGGNGSVAVTLSGPCSWVATSNVSWILITSGANGNGNGMVNFLVATNPSGQPRSGSLVIAGKSFVVTQSVIPYSISGQVTASGKGLSGVTITLSGAQTGTTQTDSDGNFSFTNLPDVGNYAVTPSKAGFSFTPVSKTFNNLSGNQTIRFIATTTVASVSAASYIGTSLAAESIVSVFGVSLAGTSVAASSLPLPTQLGGTTISVRDSNGTSRSAPLFFVSPSQINFQLPPGLASGTATVFITGEGGAVSTGTIQIVAVAPSLFSANADGQGVVAAVVVRLNASGIQSYEEVAVFDTAQNKFVSKPIDLGPNTDQVFLGLFGTGIRFRSALSAVSVTIGGVNAEVLYAGAQGDLVGLDQINVRAPRSLIGRGEVDLVLTVDGMTPNTVKVNIR